MSWLVKCDGCDKTVPALMENGHHKKPSDWFQRKDEKDGEILDSCSLDCIEKINEKIGKAAKVLQ